MNKMLNKFLTSIYEQEIQVNRNIQTQFEFSESILRHINDYLDPVYIINFWIPLAGSLDHKLLVQLVSSLGLINTLASVIKWCLPEYRPVWWIKENAISYRYNFRDIKIDAFSCDTSAGFPSTHATAFTAFILIMLWRFVNSFSNKYLLLYFIASLISSFLWFTRLYFLYEFLHQCIIGSLLALTLLHVIKRLSTPLMNLRKMKAVLLVIGIGLIPINVYFGMLYLDVDPFWSVRMAFKWCADPLHLRHESSPVFILFRDFGYLLGIALSCPLAKSYDNTANNYRKRLLILFIIEVINVLMRSSTPKQYGRFIFIAYEFLRNCLHSIMLLNILPKFDSK